MRKIGKLFPAALMAFAVGLTVSTPPAIARDLILAEPVHGVSFLPIYVAHRKGYFKEEGIDLKITNMAGNVFVNAVVTGQAFAFIGSVDHNAFAKVNGKELKAVSNLVGRANIYLSARQDLMPVKQDPGTFLKGKRIAVASYGRTPNNVLRYFLSKWNLQPGKDVTIIEVETPTVPNVIAAKQADVGVTSEPYLTKAVKQGIWGEPFFNAARELGPYADTAVSVSAVTIEKEPALVKSFVRAVMRGLIYTNTHRSEMMEIAKLEFPTASHEDLEAGLRRAFTDNIFSADGFIPEEAWKTGLEIVRGPNILKEDVAYNDVIDMRFVRELRAELGL
jgi:NitT/TauT family transport system substrate-binding protein